MLGLMMNMPLSITSILSHAALNHPDREIVSRTSEGAVHRYVYANFEKRCKKLANALQRMGLQSGDRVGTLAWNGYRHLELYYGVSCSGFVCHTINPRLFQEQIAYIIEHADDSVLFVDLAFVPIIEALADRLAHVKAVVVMTDPQHMPASAILPDLICYETLIEAEPEVFDWPQLDENTASCLCYTSGTTGEPKGVLYSHRSIVLHALTACLPDLFDLSAKDVVVPVVPMFHVNAWSIPFAALIVGAKLVLPGPNLDGASLHGLFESEAVTFTAGVPTVWLCLLDWMDAHKKTFSTLSRVVIGGSAPPPVMIERLQARGVIVLHAWGMTETSPLGLASTLLPKHHSLSAEEQLRIQVKQGRAIYGVEMRVDGADGKPITRNGAAFGSLLVRGPWVAAGYYNSPTSAAHEIEGWFNTNDVVTIDEDNYVQIIDRTKDVIKSGGEWISSIELENIAQAHEAIAEAAVVAKPDPKWGERPALVVRLHPGAQFSHDDMVAHYAGKIEKWSVPDEVIIVDELPHTATGKLLKSAIRNIVTNR
ncbi:long-chain fatty acid--CoA ligase [Ochrobactrum sp. P6BS-III]|uniref:long-chain-fatty-acid--CoA ligase n=1 Tax=unclassified Ochrobactrum TaxID=239106 RepID=UPI0009935B2C|nr:fatty-acyl-CoA synthase [Ochrobactrum sp. P6BSIII]OOL13563.1 long-chain fatty acid--CoA ligase [Ochrobactrum sp. P6BS-III]